MSTPPMSQPMSREEVLFFAALELSSADERAALLDRECAGDAALRAGVEGLLRANEKAESGFLDALPDITVMLPDTGATVISEQTIMLDSPVAKGGTAPVSLPPDIYAVGGEIARGGMGSILEAEDRKLGRKVAMKVMRLDASASEDARGRFVREATVLARLEHPNIVPIHELGWDAENRLFYTMKLVQGRTLQAILNGLKARDADFVGHYTLDRLLTIFRKICDALSMAHAKGVIHRDLKPENVMVGEFGEVLVMDWGIAKILGDAAQVAEESARKAEATEAGTAGKFRDMADEELRRGSAEQTMDGTVMGTPHYMSPEQADGRVSEIDQQSDVFSLGAILYALLTLHPPVEALSIREVLERIRQGDIRPPTTFNVTTKGGKGQSIENVAAHPKKFQPVPHCPSGRVPAALSAVTMRALTVDKAKRYPTVAAFAADIEKYQSGFATSAEEAGLFTQMRLLVQRHQREFAVGFAAWLLITALAVWFVFNLRAKERETQRQAELAKAAEAVAVQERDTASKALARSALSLAEASLREGNGPAMRTALEDVPENLRGTVWRYLFDQSDSSFATLDFGRGIDDVAAHPRLPHVFAVIDHSGTVTMLNVRTGERLLEFKVDVRVSDGRFYRMALSQDGERIAIASGGISESDIAVHDARDGRKLFSSESGGTNVLAFSSDGRLVLQGGKMDVRSSTNLTLRDATSGKILWTVNGPALPLSLMFLADDRQILLQASNAPPAIFSVADGSLLRKLDTDSANTAALSPDGQSVVTLSATGVVRGVDLEGKDAGFELSVGDQYVQSSSNWMKVAFSGSGDRFVTVIPLGDGRQSIRVWDAKTHAPRQVLLGGMGPVLGAAIHPLSGELIVVGPQTRAWSLDGARSTFRAQNSPSFSVAFWGSDDLVLIGANDAPGMALYPLDDGVPSGIWKSLRGRNHRVADVSADGQVAAVGWNVNHPVSVLRREGREVREVGSFEHQYHLNTLRLSPNGDRAATIQSLGLGTELYMTATGKRAVRLDRPDLKRFFDLAWLDDRHLLGLAVAHALRGSAGAEEQIVVWDPTTGKILRRATNPSAMDVLAVAPDGRRFAEAGADKMVRIRDAATLAVLKEFRAHDGPITALAWHPTKAILATGSEDLTVRLWNLDTDKRLEEFRGPLLAPHCLDFSPGGGRLACAAIDGTTRIWEPPTLHDETAAPLNAGAAAIDEHVWFKDPLSYRPAAPEPKKPKPSLPKDADGWEDHLAALTPAEVEKTGHGWSLKDGELFSPDAKGQATLPLPGEVSGTSYQVRVKLRRIAEKGVFHILLPVADRMCGFDLDGRSSGGIYTGLVLNWKNGKNLPGAVEGKQVKDTEPHDLEVTVRLDGENATITTTLDTRPLYTWTGRTAALTQNPAWATTAPGALALGTYAGGWAVSEVKLKRLEK